MKTITLDVENTVIAPSMPFVNAVRNKVLHNISYEKTYKCYLRKGIIKPKTKFSDFLTSCGMVMLARLSCTELPSYYSIENMFNKIAEVANNSYSQTLRAKGEAING